MSSALAAITVIQADFHNPQHAAAYLEAIQSYALDPFGGGAPLSDYARENLVAKLGAMPTALCLLAMDGAQVAGMAMCFEGFSTFACKPLINLHDFAVLPAYRGRGVGQLLMARLEELARARGCCKITLEVLEGNKAAQALYEKLGFGGYTLGDTGGHALFWQKKLS